MINESVRDFILKQAKRDFLSTWWMNDFYENFCKFMKWDFEEIVKNARRIRYYLYNLEKENLLISKAGGTGICGRSDFGMSYNKNWFLTEKGIKILEGLEKQ